MVIPTFSSGAFERTLLSNECLTAGSNDRRLQHRFLVLRKLGQGTYGKVQLAINKETNQEVAIKTIKKGNIESEEDMLRIRREIHIMKSIRHPYIIHIHEVFETRQKIVIVMQYASGGELYDYLGCHNSLPEEEARRIFRQIASAIYYCHKNKICHRDLKLENILLDDVGNAQIADFGLSNIFDEKRRMNTFCGSPLYASPEIVKGTPYKGPEVDCWSLGVLLYTLIYGTMPFDGRNFKELVTQISEGRYEEPSNKSSASTLIRRLLTPDISRRATITDVCLDSWVNEGYGTSLLNIAEKMAWDANLKTKSLSLSKFALEQNGHEKAIPVPVVKKPNITQNGTPEISNSLNGHNGEVSRNSDLYEQILNYDVKFIINKLLGALESSAGVSQNKIIPPALILPIKENGVAPLKPWPQMSESNVASKVESAYVIPIFEVTSVVPKTNKIIRKRNSVENTEQCSKQLPNGIIHKTINGIFQKEGKSKPTTEKKDTFKENQEQTKTETEKSSAKEDKPQLKKQQNHQSKNRHNNENFKFASKHMGFRNNALTLARIFSAKYERLVRTSIKLPERKRPVPGKLVIPSTFDPATASCNEAAQKKEQILLFPTVSVSENKEKIEKKIDKIKKAALNRNQILRSNSQNRLKIQKFLLSQAKKMQDFMCEEQRGGNGSMLMHHLNKCDIPPEVYHLFDKTPLNAIGTRQHSKRINFNDFGKNRDFDLARRKMFRVNYLSIRDECSLSIAKSKSDVQFPTYFASSDQHYGNLLDVPHCATIQRSASDSEGLQIFRNAFEYIKHCENNKNDFEMSYKLPNSVYDQHLHDKGHLTVSSQLTKGNIQGTSRRFMEKDNHTNKEEESKAVQRSNSISICTDLLNTSSNFSFIRKQLPSFNILGKENNKYLLNKNDTVATKKLKSFLSKVNVFYGNQKELLKEQIIKRCNSSSSIPDRKFLFQNKKSHNMNIFGKERAEISFENRFAVLSEQSLSMNHSKNEANFLSSPNLYPNDFEAINQSRFNDRKSIDSLNSRLSSSNDSEEFDFLASMRRSSQTSQFLRKMLHNSYDNDNLDSELISTRVRAKSLVEGTFSSDDMVRKLSNSHGVGQNKFLSKFLNELENRENGTIKKDPKLNMRHSRNSSPSGKNPKLEKRSQSFLQLLALKRIHEAEKELDKAERNHTVDAEEESAGSLLEALKTHGYKGVISQLSQDTENNSTDPFNTSSYLSRKRALDLHRYNTSYYDPMQQFTYPSYDINNLDLTSYDALEFSPYSNNLDLPPYNSLDNDYNNFDLTYNLDQSPYNFDLTPYNTSDLTPYSNNLELTSYNNGLDETPYTTLDSSPYSLNYKSYSPKQYLPRLPTQPSEHRSKFTPGEASASDTPNWERDPKPDEQSQEALNEQGNQEPIKKYSITELPNTFASPRTEKNPLLRASSTSEDERESVQDRIWRKSFYSRFNNSALSRKERSSLLDSEFSPEVRANGIYTPFKSSHRDHSKWQSSKRVETARKYSLTRDSSVASSRSRQRSYDISDENISKMDSDI